MRSLDLQGQAGGSAHRNNSLKSFSHHKSNDTIGITKTTDADCACCTAYPSALRGQQVWPRNIGSTSHSNSTSTSESNSSYDDIIVVVIVIVKVSVLEIVAIITMIVLLASVVAVQRLQSRGRVLPTILK